MHVRISVLARSYKSLGREEFGRPEERRAWQKQEQGEVRRNT